MMNRSGFALLFGLATLCLVGCNKPCATTTDCGSGDVCVAALCRSLTCEEALFARDPKSGACVALSGCYLTDDQRSWPSCQEDPCAGLGESSCLTDTRCQVAYTTPDRDLPASSSLDGPSGSTFFCNPAVIPNPPRRPGDPDDIVTAPGVNNGEQPKHGSFDPSCLPGTSRKYAGCRAVPQITPPPTACNQLTTAQCQSRSDCSTSRNWNSAASSSSDFSGPGQCFDLHPRQPTCVSADALSCLTNPGCQPIGASCYCPPGATCDCSGGGYLGCEKNDRLRRCSSSAECNSGERCDNNESCIAPRTFAAVPTLPTPGSTGCLGACVPAGCAGLGEEQCNADPTCDAGSYATACTPKQYYGGPTLDVAEDLGTGCTESTCTCTSKFSSCAAATPSLNLRAERSLLVRDPEIIDDPAFSLLAVLTQLAPAGQVSAFGESLLGQLGAGQRVNSGAMTKARLGFTKLYQNFGAATRVQEFSKLMATTALINRLDLASAGNCGQARVAFAMTSAYVNGNERLTLIVEAIVPDDGNGCKTVAQRWAELSAIDDLGQRRTQLIALYKELLTPAHLGQIRTNEFVNLNGDEPWELREFHLRPTDGLMELAPVAQTLDPAGTAYPAVLSWLSANAAGVKAGTAIIPTLFLAGASTEDGGRLRLAQLTDPVIPALEKSVNEQSCAGCHLTETKSPFVHIGERLATKVGSEYRPSGRAVIDDFLQKELVKRTTLLVNVLTGTQGVVGSDWRPLVQARVH